MAGARHSSALLVCLVGLCSLCALTSTFIAPARSAGQQRALRGENAKDLAAWAGAVAALAAPEAAHARLPEEWVMFAPIVDVLPSLPFFFFLLAFLWQASVGFR
mmetsp:Transcript_58491/g.136082  ORF Transcript_58491/g.136082 Transcript_58491/m.136082 type:complete len:104 (-) Transcript_58491:115-426(-)